MSVPLTEEEKAARAARRAEIEERRQQGIRPNKPAYEDTPLLAPGNPVRVKVAECWRRATVDCADEDEGTVDVTFTHPTDAKGEVEVTLPISAVRPLEAFEVRPDEERRKAFEDDLYGAAAAAKEAANTVFRLGDTEAAVEYYTQAIEELRRFRSPAAAVGCHVLLNQQGALVPGRIQALDTEVQRATVAASTTAADAPIVTRTVAWRALIPMHTDHLPLQGSLYMNRARGLMQAGCHQEAAQDLSVVIGLWASAGGPRGAAEATVPEERKEQLTKAHYLRAKTRLARLRIEPARSDAREAWALEPPDAIANLLRQLDRDINVVQKEQVRSNKKIAKEIMKFADSAMSGLGAAQMEALGQAVELPTA